MVTNEESVCLGSASFLEGSVDSCLYIYCITHLLYRHALISLAFDANTQGILCCLLVTHLAFHDPGVNPFIAICLRPSFRKSHKEEDLSTRHQTLQTDKDVWVPSHLVNFAVGIDSAPKDILCHHCYWQYLLLFKFRHFYQRFRYTQWRTHVVWIRMLYFGWWRDIQHITVKPCINILRLQCFHPDKIHISRSTFQVIIFHLPILLTTIALST